MSKYRFAFHFTTPAPGNNDAIFYDDSSKRQFSVPRCQFGLFQGFSHEIYMISHELSISDGNKSKRLIDSYEL